MGHLFLNLAFRQFKKHTLYSIVNLLGLAIGLCAFILIVVYLQHEFTYEKQHHQRENIYRFTFINSSGQQFAICPSGMYNHVKQELPDVKEAVRLLRPYSGLSMALVQHESVSYYEQNIVYADSTFSKVFTLDLLEGDESGLCQSNGFEGGVATK